MDLQMGAATEPKLYIDNQHHTTLLSIPMCGTVLYKQSFTSCSRCIITIKSDLERVEDCRHANRDRSRYFFEFPDLNSEPFSINFTCDANSGEVEVMFDWLS